MADSSGRPQSSGVARRRRERRLRSVLRHERMTVAMALAEKLHHSSRGQRMAEDHEMHYTAEFWTHPPPQAAGTVYFAMDVDDVTAALGYRPDRLSEVRPQERAQRRTVQQIVDPVPLPTLDDPAPQMVGQLLNLAHFLGTPSPSKCPRSCLTMFRCEPWFARRSWRNSWWKCRRSYLGPCCS